MTDTNPGLRIEQIDSEMVRLEKELDRIKDGKDAGSARNRAEMNERMQQLKAEKNHLIKQQNTSQD